MWEKINIKILTRKKNSTMGKCINGNIVECVALILPQADEQEQDVPQNCDTEPL